MIGVPHFTAGQILRAADLETLTAAVRELEAVVPMLPPPARSVAEYRSFAAAGRLELLTDSAGTARLRMGETLWESGQGCRLLHEMEYTTDYGSLAPSVSAFPGDGVGIYVERVAEISDGDGQMGSVRFDDVIGADVTAAVMDADFVDGVFTGSVVDGDAVLRVVREQDGVVQLDVGGGGMGGCPGSVDFVLGIASVSILPGNVFQPLSFNAFSYRMTEHTYAQGRHYWMARLDQFGGLRFDFDTTDLMVTV